MPAAVATPRPGRAHLRLVRDGERPLVPGLLLDVDVMPPEYPPPGFQLGFSIVPMAARRRRARCASRGPRVAAPARRWLRLVALAFDCLRSRARELPWPQWHDGRWIRRSRKLRAVDKPVPTEPMRKFLDRFGLTMSGTLRRDTQLREFGSKPIAVSSRRGTRAMTAIERTALSRDLAGLRRDGIQTEQPRTWGECQKLDLPWCPWVGCENHLYLGKDPETGAILANFPDKEPWELEETCVLKAIKRHPEGMAQEKIASLMNADDYSIGKTEIPALRKYRERLLAEGRVAPK